jgi:hypothetical protein
LSSFLATMPAVAEDDGSGDHCPNLPVEDQLQRSYRQRLFVEHDLGEQSGSTLDAARRAEYPWTEQISRKLSRKVRETRSSSSQKRSERGQKYWQRVELGIHSLKSWGRNWSRKVRETRSSSSGAERASHFSAPGKRGWPQRPSVPDHTELGLFCINNAQSIELNSLMASG